MLSSDKSDLFFPCSSISIEESVEEATLLPR